MRSFGFWLTIAAGFGVLVVVIYFCLAAMVR